MRARPARRRGITAAGLTVLLLAAACGATDAAAPTPTPSPTIQGPISVRTATVAVEGLCEIKVTFPNDPRAAADLFENRVHEHLHEIARAVQTGDPAAAGALLEAKEVVETDLAGDPVPARLPKDVAELETATRDALSTLGLEMPPC